MNPQKFKEMPTKKKIQWLVQYYGVATVVGIIVIATALYFIKSVFFAPPEADINVLILSDAIYGAGFENLEQDFEAELGVDASFSLYGENDAYGRQAFAAKIGADRLEIVICPLEEVTLLSENGYLLSYGEIKGTSLYIGVPKSAKNSDKLLEGMEFLENKFLENENEQG